MHTHRHTHIPRIIRSDRYASFLLLLSFFQQPSSQSLYSSLFRCVCVCVCVCVCEREKKKKSSLLYRLRGGVSVFSPSSLSLSLSPLLKPSRASLMQRSPN